LVARTIVVMGVGVVRHPFFVRAPTEFGWRNAFFIEALD
jgi:hypothetical protein